MVTSRSVKNDAKILFPVKKMPKSIDFQENNIIIDVQMDLVIRTGPENVASIVHVFPFHQLQATYHVIIGSNFQ